MRSHLFQKDQRTQGTYYHGLSGAPTERKTETAKMR